MRWKRGEIIVRRGIWRPTPWLASPVIVVEDTPELLVRYLSEKAQFAFPPSVDGRPDPRAGRGGWTGHGMAILQRPGEA